MNKKVAIGVLAYNVEKYIEKLVIELDKLKVPIFIIDDHSNDATSEILDNLKEEYFFNVVRNEKNLGAGASTKKLIQLVYSEDYEMLLKVDGDGQFSLHDIIKILELANNNDYKLIKSNRFWNGGIQGKIPKKRFFGNLLATMFLQLTTGTNKLYDPLNGLFAISTSIISELDKKYYPKRYGYPYFLVVASIVNGYKTFQINNTVIYDDQISKLKPTKVLFTIIKLTIIFYFKKINIKKSIGIFQRSAFLDLVFVFNTLVTFYLILQIIYTVYIAEAIFIKTSNLFLLFIFSLFLSFASFISSFKEEKAIRNTYIYSEE